MVSVCMYGCMLDNCLREKSITYSHTQRNFFFTADFTHTKEFFLTADLAWPKLTPPPPPPPRDRIGQHLPLTWSFQPFPRIKWCIYWPNLKVIHAFSRELWPFKKKFFSTFLYILQFSNANNSLNKQDRNSFKFKNSFIFGFGIKKKHVFQILSWEFEVKFRVQLFSPFHRINWSIC